MPCDTLVRLACHLIWPVFLQLRHNAIMQRQAQYDKQTKLVTEKESRLAQFLDLPPDMTAAKAVYNHKLHALLAARRQLEEGLAGL